MKIFLMLSALVGVAISQTSCETTALADVESPVRQVVVEGTLFYPDEENVIYIVPGGAEVIGAGGRNCRYIVEEGGALSAHGGDGNTYLIKPGASFSGFAHPANNCRVHLSEGATVDLQQAGP
ncbi:MAG: hypothetical protein AAF357_09195, partial [Verrucomicrobiota bacterium]